MSDTALPLLLEVSVLAGAQPSAGTILLLDVSSAENYNNGHIPGALHVPPAALMCGMAPAPGKLPDPGQLHELFSALGLSDTQHVVAYDDEGGGWAGRLLWTLEVLGHHNYSYLNGGIHAWRAAGYQIQTTPNQATYSDFEVELGRAAIAEVDDIVPRLADSNFKVWDARSAAEYRGERSGSMRAGHIPGAINLDWLELIDRDNDSRLVDVQLLQQRLDALGLSKDQDIVTHCQSHHRSGLTWLAMKILGYPSARAFPGSWGEWGNRDDTPIEI